MEKSNTYFAAITRIILGMYDYPEVHYKTAYYLFPWHGRVIMSVALNLGIRTRNFMKKRFPDRIPPLLSNPFNQIPD
jgi:hypothetical protein